MVKIMSNNLLINSDSGKIIFKAKEGQTIKEVLSDADIFLDAPCGGNGTQPVTGCTASIGKRVASRQ